MSELTLDKAIKHCLEVADKNEIDSITYKNCKEIKTNMYEKLLAEKVENDCKECAADHRQLAAWLTELKDLRAENKVLISECDRLIKEKGKLLKMTNRPCTLCGNNCQVSLLEQFKTRNGLCEAREQMYRKKKGGDAE